MTQQDVLAKHKGKPPSMRIHLHKAHFRINDSQETLPYQGPMQELLYALRRRVIPQNMLDDLYAIETPFYDNCLIVEVHDYRSAGVKPKDETNSTGEGGSSAFSIHNYNNFITPSPFVPYPSPKPDIKAINKDEPSKNGDAKEDKENMPAPGQNGTSQKQPGGAKIFTVVLFPTPQTHLADIELLANTPMPDIATLKRMQAAGRAGGVPPTPLSAMPPTPTFPSGPGPKRQKMCVDDSNIHEFEAEVYNATCPKLYLEPTKSLQESQAIMDAITHPNNKNLAPARKTRKRTTAELAADEAEAQDLQRFMLAGDEQQATMGSTATGNDEGAARAAANSQTFSRFKTIATIRANHEEAERRKKEEDARNAAAKRQAQADAEAQKRRDMEANRQQAEVQERQQQLLRQQQEQRAHLQNQLQQNEALRAVATAQNSMSNVNAAPVSQAPQAATQPHFSPVVRQHTPMGPATASPHIGGQTSMPIGGTPMVPTGSNQPIASPARPPSTVSHHPNSMARTASQPHNNMSRTGTPQMMQGTPAMPNRNMTPTPSRMNQTSPSLGMQGQTPMNVMNTMNTPQPGQNMTPEAMQQLQATRQMQALRMQQMAAAQGGTSGHQQLQQMALNKAAMHISQQGVPPGQNPQAYRQQLAQQYFRQLSQSQQQQAMQNMSPQGGMLQGGAQQQQGMGVNLSSMNLQQLRQQYATRKQHLMSNYGAGNIPPQFVQQMQQLEQAIKQRADQQTQQAQQVQQSHMQQQQMNSAQQMNGMQNVQNPGQMQQMQQYQQMLQTQRQNQARQQQMMAMQQRAMAQGGQIPQGMMNNMQGMNMGNMQAMQNMQGMNMAQMNHMQGMQGGQGMQGMQGMNMGQMNQQQMQQMMMMRHAQQQAQRMGQQGQQGGDNMPGWNGV